MPYPACLLISCMEKPTEEGSVRGSSGICKGVFVENQILFVHTQKPTTKCLSVKFKVLCCSMCNDIKSIREWCRVLFISVSWRRVSLFASVLHHKERKTTSANWHFDTLTLHFPWWMFVWWLVQQATAQSKTCAHVCKFDKKKTRTGNLMCVVVQSLV